MFNLENDFRRYHCVGNEFTNRKNRWTYWVSTLNLFKYEVYKRLTELTGTNNNKEKVEIISKMNSF